MRIIMALLGLLLPLAAHAQTATIIDLPPPGCIVGGPCTLSTLSLTGSQAQRNVLAAPAGGAGAPSFRSLVAADVTGLAASATTDATNAGNITSGVLDPARIPAPGASFFGGVRSYAAPTHMFFNLLNTSGVFGAAQPSASDILGLANSATIDATNASNITAGTLGASRLPVPSASSLGGVQSLAATSHQFLTGIGANGVPSSAQPAAADVSGLGGAATLNVGTTLGTVAAGNDSRLAGAVQSTAVGATNGIATLDGSGQVPTGELGNAPSITTSVITPNFNAASGTLPGQSARIANAVDICGAVPDNSTDNAAAINACSDAGYRIYFPSAPGYGATFTPTLSGGTLSAVTLVTAGSRYYGAVDMKVIGGQGSGASITVFVSSTTGQIDTTQGTGSGGGYTINAAGANYSSSTTAVSFLSGCSVSPTATLTVTGGAVTALTFGTLGSNCSWAPIAVISPGTVAQVTGTTSGGAFTGVTVNVAGTGYTVTPTILAAASQAVYGIHSPIHVHSWGEFFGDGIGRTVIKQLPGGGGDVFHCDNFYALSSTGNYDAKYTGSVDEISIHDLTIDGGAGVQNAWSNATQSGPLDHENGIACYGMHHSLHHLKIQNVGGHFIYDFFRYVGSDNQYDLGHSVLSYIYGQSAGLDGFILGTHDSYGFELTATNACQSADDKYSGFLILGGSTSWTRLHPANTGTSARCQWQLNAASGGGAFDGLEIEGGRRDAVFGANARITNSHFFAPFPTSAETGLGMVLVFGANASFVNNRFDNNSGNIASCIQVGQPGVQIGSTSIIGGQFNGCGITTPVDMTYSSGSDTIISGGLANSSANPNWQCWTTGGTQTFISHQPGVVYTCQGGIAPTIASQTISFPTGGAGDVAEIGVAGTVSAIACTGATVNNCPASLTAGQTVTCSWAASAYTCGSPITLQAIGYPVVPASSTMDFFQSGNGGAGPGSAEEILQFGTSLGVPYGINAATTLAAVAKVSPSSGSIYTPGVASSGGVISTVSGTLAAWTINFPQGAKDNQQWLVCSFGPVASLTEAPATGDSIAAGNASSLSTSECQYYLYTLSTRTWATTQTSYRQLDLSTAPTIGSVAPNAGVFTSLGHGLENLSTGCVQKFSPSNGATVTVQAGTCGIRFINGGTLTSVIIALPTPTNDNVLLPVQCIGGNVSGITYSGATVSNGPTSCTQATPFKLQWDATTTTYYLAA